MASFVIEGGHRLSGEIHPQGAKNEVLQIICATLLTAEEVTVDNIPDILDVNNLIQLMREEMFQPPWLSDVDRPHGCSFRKSVNIETGRR